ncbi:RNA-binding domain-containing protein [Pedobacter glucosidilyticus]|uniref:RNA-binding domain-containing protein n=1 Tax=Pedobacter glucosidilyticus TaxID=1122941 RepID=UPI0004274E9A|nr:RNA-binding domain-containing protein [Pedobacter glucosidilyticus]
MSETNRIEYKQELSKEIDIEKEVVAFLNYKEGGIIYIGIDKFGVSIGVADTDGDMLKIKDRLKNNILPSCLGLFDVSSEKRDAKDIIKIVVASGVEKPYYLKKYGMSEKGCFIRTGTAAEPMPQRMIDDLFSKRTRNSIGKIRSNRQDLTFEQLKIYYNGKGKTLNQHFASNLEMLTPDETYNYVAYLMADENGNSIKFAKYSGTTRVDLTENKEFGYCSLIKATINILDKLEVENVIHTTITSKERINKQTWDATALREAVLNAFVHNDYTTEIPPKFEVFDDRIEITSSGSLPAGFSEEEFFEGISAPRNKELMRIYRDLELVEQLGSGIPRILKTYNRSCFKFFPNFIRMTFPKLAGGQVGGQAGGQVGGQVGGQAHKIMLTERQKEVFELIKNSPDISRSQLAIKLGINESAIQKHIDALKQKGVIEREGETTGFWKILKINSLS